MISVGLSPRQRRRPTPRGPISSSPPSVSPMVAGEGVQVTRTQGTYTARGGGSVNITTSEWRIDGAQVGAGATYVPGGADVGGLLTYFEVATESGGSAPGTTIKQVIVGYVGMTSAAYVEDGYVEEGYVE